ncbi:MAG: hypothetical protein KBG22_00890 [Smithella sp.]|nr:hypothetical protein [Smithella sp.]MDM7988145.1 hypothetical protein [Smithella sp.]HQH17254.1 hypothetical protein [Smithella sp.]
MDWKNWKPFQSKEVKDICNHLTEQEKMEVESFLKITGLMFAIFIVFPITFGILIIIPSKSSSLISVFIIWINMGTIILLYRYKKFKKLLCSTLWAKSQNYTPDKI